MAEYDKDIPGLTVVNDMGLLVPSDLAGHEGEFLSPTGSGYQATVKINVDTPRYKAALTEIENIPNRLGHAGNEELIAIETARIVHKYWGSYHKALSEIQTKMTAIERQIDYVEGAEETAEGKEELDNKIAASSKEDVLKDLQKEAADAKEIFDKEYEERGGKDLGEYGDNALVCREETLLASHFLEKNGIENHIVTGYVTYGSEGAVEEGIMHAFLVIDKSGAVLDPTSNDPLSSYKTPAKSTNALQDLKEGNAVTYISRANPHYKITYSADPTAEGGVDLVTAKHQQTAQETALLVKPHRGHPDEIAFKKFEQLYSDFIDANDRNVAFSELQHFVNTELDALSIYFQADKDVFLKEMSLPLDIDESKQLLAQGYLGVIKDSVSLTGLESAVALSDRVEMFNRSYPEYALDKDYLAEATSELLAEEKAVFDNMRMNVSWMSGEEEVKAFSDCCADLDSKIESRKFGAISDLAEIFPNFIDGKPENDQESIAALKAPLKLLGIDNLPELEFKGKFVGTGDVDKMASILFEYIESNLDDFPNNNLSADQVRNAYIDLAQGRFVDNGVRQTAQEAVEILGSFEAPSESVSPVEVTSGANNNQITK